MARIGNINYDGNDQRFKAIKDLLNSVELQEIEANPSDTPTESLESLRIDEDIYSLGGGTIVVPNPQGTPTDDLETVQIGEDIYEIKGGSSEIADLEDVDLNNLSNGQILKYNSTSQKWENSNESGGTVVIANPSGTPTDELNSIQIGNDIYEITGGGGGGSGSGRTIVSLWQNEGNTNPDTITLSKAYTNYDDFIVMCYRSANNKMEPEFYNFISDRVSVGQNFACLAWSGSSDYVTYSVTDTTTFTKVNQGSHLLIKEVMGIKYSGGSGGSGSGYSITNLWSGDQRGPMEVPLSDDINNYDAIEFTTKLSSNGAYNVIVVDAKSFSTKYPYSASVSQNIPHYCLLGYDNLFGRVITGQTTSSIYIWDLSSTMRLAEVNGIKYESGGGASSVSELTDVDLTDLSDGQILKYDSTEQKWINADESGGSGGISAEIIPIADPTNTTSRTLTLQNTPKKVSMSWNTSDNWYFHWEFTWGDGWASWLAKSTTSISGGATTGLSKIEYGQDNKSFTITGANAAQAANSTGGSGLLFVDYGGSGSGGGSFEIIDLWENTTGAGTGEQTLSNSIDDFDLLSIWCGVYAEYTGSPYVIQQCMISVSELNALYSNNKHFVFSGYDNRATYMDFYGDKVNVTNVYNNQNLLKVLGIKCGGSGTNSEEISKEDYAQIVPKQDKVYFVYGNKTNYIFGHKGTGTSYKYTDASNTNENLAVFVSLSNIIYAGFFFNKTTRVSTIMTSEDLSYFANLEGLSYTSSSTVTLTQDTNTPSLYWVNGNNRDTLYLDATSLSNVGTKCGYSGCSSYLYYDEEVPDNSINLNNRVYSSGSGINGVHYSTDEQVIGTWIDGKPLYQKTFEVNVHTQTTGWVDSGVVISNLKNIIDVEIDGIDTYAGDVPANMSSVAKRYYNNNLQLLQYSNWYITYQHITVKYTKTID